MHDGRADHRDRRVGALARHRIGPQAVGPRRVHLRDLRRLLLPRQADRRRRRRRLGDGGSDLPHASSRRRSPSSTGATRCARRRSCRTRRSPIPKIEFIWDSEVADVNDVAKGEVTGIVVRNLKTGAAHRVPLDGVFIAIGHTPNTVALQGTDRARRQRLHRDARRQPGRACPACSPPATSRITSTARRSRPPAPAAWRPSTPSATSKGCRARPSAQVSARRPANVPARLAHRARPTTSTAPVSDRHGLQPGVVARAQPARLASRRVARRRRVAARPRPHNIWELLVHAAYWKYVRGAASRARRRVVSARGLELLRASGHAHGGAWREDLACSTRCIAICARPCAGPAQRARPRIRPAGRDERAPLTGAAAHDLYHAGQIQLLKRLADSRVM